MPGKPTKTMPHAQALRRAYRLLLAHFGHQHWWPGETPFEVCIGAILTQSTSWTNVEQAIRNLKNTGAFNPHAMFALSETELAKRIRPAGYYNIKARRLRSFLQVLVQQFGGDVRQLLRGETGAVRQRLLGINGIGPETADCMLLYAGEHHRFVVDAYTRRIFHRHGWSAANAQYDDLQKLCETALDVTAASERLDYWQDFHAQLVTVGKHFCRSRQPACDLCPLKRLLPRTEWGQNDRTTR